MTFHYKEIGKRLSNWGRWGVGDELGTLNNVTEEGIKAAARSVRSGKRFELSISIGSDGPPQRTGRMNRVNPVHLMNVLPTDFKTPDNVMVSDDYIIMPLQAGTQWDGLAHIGYDGYFYNGIAAESVQALGGAKHNSIDKVLPGVAGRGVLLDIARLKGLDWLPAGYEIEPHDLELAEATQGVNVGAGDILLVRTGWRKKALVEGWDEWLGPTPGLSLECAEWIHGRQMAAVASDNWAVEVQPARDGFLPLHCILIRDMGMLLGEMFDLEELSTDCSQDGQWDFFFSAPPLRITGAVGSPVSPMAFK